MKGPFPLLNLFYLISLGLYFGLMPLQIASAKTVDSILVVVGEEVILKSDLDLLKKNLERKRLVDFEYAKLLSKDNLLEHRESQIEYLISEKIFFIQAKKLGIYDTAKNDLKDEIGKIAASNQMTYEELKSEIESQGIDFKDYKAFTLSSLVRKKIIEQVIASKIDISEPDIIQHLQRTNSEVFIPKFEYKLSHILISNPKEVNKVEKAIDSLGFYNALKYSEDKSPRGTLGTFKDGEMAPEIYKAVKQLKINEVSPAIRINDSIFFIKLDDKVRVNSLPNSPAVMKARSELIQQNLSKEIKNWLENLIQTTHIQNFSA